MIIKQLVTKNGAAIIINCHKISKGKNVYLIVISIGVQSFQLEYKSNSKSSAIWFAEQTKIALENLGGENLNHIEKVCECGDIDIGAVDISGWSCTIDKNQFNFCPKCGGKVVEK